MIFVRALGGIRLLMRGLAFFVLRIFAPVIKKIDAIIFYHAVFPIYWALRSAFHTAEGASLPARRKILCMLAGRQAVPFFLLMTALLVAASNIYAKTTIDENEPGERSILFALFGSGNDELTYEEGGSAPDPLVLATNTSAVSVALGQDHVSDEEDEVLSLIIGESAVIQPIISSASPSAAPRNKVETYIVKLGDTPGGIAKRFGLNLNTLYWANNLSAYSVIRLGQELKIPPVDGVVYQIKKGDTVEKIAKSHRAESGRIIAYNRLTEDEKLQVGTVIIIPNGRPPAPASSSSKPVTPRTTLIPTSPSSALAGGKFLWPVLAEATNNGRYITQYFKWRHPGVDIDGGRTNPIVASSGGTVKLVHYGKIGYGYQVVIDHGNGILSRYAHLSQIYVEHGQTIEKGQQLGIVGSTGRSTGTHLHYEIFVNGKRVNPLSYIR